MKNKLFLTEADRKQILVNKEKIILENFAKTFNKIKRVDENELNEMGGPYSFTKIDIKYDNPNLTTDDRINLCVSEVREKVNEIVKDVFNPPWSFVQVSFNGKKYFER
jgi:hypothetical protein